MRYTLKVGDYVKYGHPHGSIGIIESPRHYDNGFYVKWNYGLNIKGEPMTALASCEYDCLMPIPSEFYMEYTNTHSAEERQFIDDKWKEKLYEFWKAQLS